MDLYVQPDSGMALISPEDGTSTYKIILGITIVLAFLGFAMSIVALVLYSTVPQPIKPQFKKATIDVKSTKTSFTPVNFTYFVATASAPVNGGVSAKKLDGSKPIGIYYVIYNASNSGTFINVYNNGDTSSIATIPSGKASIFLVGGNGKSIHII